MDVWGERSGSNKSPVQIAWHYTAKETLLLTGGLAVLGGGGAALLAAGVAAYNQGTFTSVVRLAVVGLLGATGLSATTLTIMAMVNHSRLIGVAEATVKPKQAKPAPEKVFINRGNVKREDVLAALRDLYKEHQMQQQKRSLWDRIKSAWIVEVVDSTAQELPAPPAALLPAPDMRDEDDKAFVRAAFQLGKTDARTICPALGWSPERWAQARARLLQKRALIEVSKRGDTVLNYREAGRV